MSYAGEIAFACVLAPLVAAAFWLLDSRMRRRSYGSANARAWRKDLLADPIVGDAINSHSKNAVKPAWFDGCQEAVDRLNKRSGTQQQLYRSSVAAIVGLLLISALATATSSILAPSHKSFKIVATVFDIAALLLAIALFFVARIAIREFSARRGITELARAWMHSAIVFRMGDGDPASELRSYVDAASREVDDIPYTTRWRHSGADYLVVQRWRRLLDGLRKAPTREDNTRGLFSFYVLERPVEQLLYMRKARSRLEGSAHSREWLVLILYLFTLAIAVLKVVAVFEAMPNTALLPQHFNDPNLFSLLLIALLLTAAAITNYAISQGERSLSHSYFIHEQRIYDWLKMLTPASSVAANSAAEAAAAFEQIMFDEARQFFRVTASDVIEVPG